MKKTYRLICIHHDEAWEGTKYTYTVVPLQKGLNAIQTYLDKNFEDLVKFLVKEAGCDEKAIFTLKGKKKHIQEAINALLCKTNLLDHFKIEERGY